MDLQQILLGSGGGLLILLTLIQIAPIQINPWSALAKAIGKALNVDVLHEIDKIETVQHETREILDEHIRIDDERDADMHRKNILQFNNELLRDIPHTKEDFTEILLEIDYYERYCNSHPNYRNNLAVLAIKHIKTCYGERLEKHDFL